MTWHPNQWVVHKNILAYCTHYTYTVYNLVLLLMWGKLGATVLKQACQLNSSAWTVKQCSFRQLTIGVLTLEFTAPKVILVTGLKLDGAMREMLPANRKKKQQKKVMLRSITNMQHRIYTTLKVPAMMNIKTVLHLILRTPLQFWHFNSDFSTRIKLNRLH